MSDKTFKTTNDVGNSLEIRNGSSFFWIILNGGLGDASTTVKRDKMVQLHEWLGEQLWPNKKER